MVVSEPGKLALGDRLQAPHDPLAIRAGLGHDLRNHALVSRQRLLGPLQLADIVSDLALGLCQVGLDLIVGSLRHCSAS